MKRNTIGLLALGGLALLAMSKKSSSANTTNVFPTSQNTVPVQPVYAGTSGQGTTKATAYGWTVGDTLSLDFWDSAPRRARVIITYIEQGGRAYDGSDATFSVMLLDGSRTKQFSILDFQNRNPIRQV